MTPTNDFIRGGIYARVSTLDQGEKFSLTSQIDVLKKLAAREHVVVPEEFIFVDKESGTTADRTDFTRLQAAVKTGALKWVGILSPDRYARNLFDALSVQRDFQKAGAKLTFAEVPADLETAEGRFTFQQFGAVAEFMAAKIKKDAARGRAKRLEAKKVNGRPYGFNNVDGVLVHNDATKKIVILIFKWRYEERLSLSKITKRLNQMNVPTPTGRSQYWKPPSVRSILGNKAHVGEYHEDGELIPCPPIIKREIFDAVQSLNTTMREEVVGRPSRKYLVSTFGECGLIGDDGKVCGHRITSYGRRSNTGSNKLYYRCNHHTRVPVPKRLCPAPYIPALVLELTIWRAVWDLLKNPARLRKIALSLKGDAKPGPEDAAVELQQIAARRKRVLDNYEDGDIDRATKNAKIEKLDRRAAMLEAELRALGRVVDIAPLDIVEKTCNAITTGEEPTTFDERRPILDALVEFHFVHHPETDEVTISGAVPIMPAAEAAAGNKRTNSKDGLTPLTNKYAPIPFVLKVKLAA